MPTKQSANSVAHDTAKWAADQSAQCATFETADKTALWLSNQTTE